MAGGVGSVVGQLLKEEESAEGLHKYSLEQVAQLLRNEGYASVKVEKEYDRVAFEVYGSTAVLYRYDDGDLQMFYGLTDVNVGPVELNEWNRTRRLSRAYIDEENDPVVEADLLANPGLNDEIIAEFVSVFTNITMPQFRKFILSKE